MGVYVEDRKCDRCNRKTLIIFAEREWCIHCDKEKLAELFDGDTKEIPPKG